MFKRHHKLIQILNSMHDNTPTTMRLLFNFIDNHSCTWRMGRTQYTTTNQSYSVENVFFFLINFYYFYCSSSSTLDINFSRFYQIQLYFKRPQLSHFNSKLSLLDKRGRVANFSLHTSAKLYVLSIIIKNQLAKDGV